MGFIMINDKDNVVVNTDNGHKYAARDIEKGEIVVKYGFPIGQATENIAKGKLVHTDNLKSMLSGASEYVYKPQYVNREKREPINIKAFERQNGNIGIRNDIWIIPTVGCVNKIAEKLATVTDAVAFTHPFGCSQLGDDLLRTQAILSGLVNHPNAGGVLVLGLGCENNNINSFKSGLGDIDSRRIRFLNCQDCSDEISEGTKIIEELKNIASFDKRVSVPVSKLKIGMKCGGSDGFSGITANPMCGKITDKITSMGGTVVLTEVPEMFGAEQILFDRCENEDVFNKATELINNFKNYFMSHGAPVGENPSPGNKDGGITTLEEKSLGCVQKGGNAIITDVLDYGDRAEKAGVNLLNGPGNDLVSITNLTAAGCHMILFTTGRGTPVGAPVPTVKISSNERLAKEKSNWTDFDGSTCDDEDLFELIIETANGRKTKNETNGYREIAIMKDGVIM